MAVNDVANALIKLHDRDILQRVRAGDIDAVGAPGLTEEERQLILHAAKDDPEAAGFDIVNSAFTPPLRYIAHNRRLLNKQVRSKFNALFSSRYGPKWTIALMG
jgi:hypothetical protein